MKLMKPSELKRYGIPRGRPLKLAFEAIARAARLKMSHEEIRALIQAVGAEPAASLDDPVVGELAAVLVELSVEKSESYARGPARERPVPYQLWGKDLDPTALAQLEAACRLPVAVRGALMPDAHVGYGLPIGGVLATAGAVIPYAVGVDIACRMKLTVLDLPLSMLVEKSALLSAVLQRETRFGVGATFSPPREHAVMDEDWSISSVTRQLKGKAWSQLGTSGSGNHFVEFGVLTIEQPAAGLPRGEYLALLSHSGSRGVGAQVADHYSKRAMARHPELPREMHHLAWLELSSSEGAEYWQAMELMGRYAAANHALIHQHIARALGAAVQLDLENHHNFAWREEHDGQRVIVHRKGATPAAIGTLGIIPGSMASPAYVVRGLGHAGSLNSASHGAGRLMSRKQALRTFHRRELEELLARRGVTLLSAGLDEAPLAYKDIDEVMAAQRELVEPLAHFQPKLVKMAPPGERPED